MDGVLFFDFSRDGFVEGSFHTVLVERVWSYHHKEGEFPVYVAEPEWKKVVNA